MALTTAASGTQTCVISTEHALATDTDAGVYVCMWNLTNLADGDTIELYVATKVLTGDTAENIYYAVYQHSLGATPIVVSPPVPSMFSITMYVKQTAGTGRSVPWSLLTA